MLGFNDIMTSFFLSGDEEIAKELEDIYGDIEAVEFYVGIVTERTRPNAMFGATVIELGGPFSVKGLLSVPICSKQYWKPSTFGGDVGFNIVKTATLEKLFCSNIKDCPRISFKVPPEVLERDEQQLKEEL